ncbi:MAG: HD-GYP domain-containing protein [Actinomycetota bacterium]
MDDSYQMSVTTVTDGPSVPDTGEAWALRRTQQQLLVFARDMSTMYRRQRQQARHVERLTDELKSTHHATVQTLAFVVEAKDRYTRYHLERCREYGAALTREIDGGLDTSQLEHGFLLHDVGKIVVPESILGKPGPLTDDERSVMRTHPLIGVQIVAPLRFLTPAALSVIRNHHERYDGRGYPDGLKGQRIPLPARIFSVVDAFDAMTTDRPYRRALPVHESLRRLREGAGTQFDPAVVDAFENLVERLPIFELAGAHS